MDAARRVLVYGCSGSLGMRVSALFKSANWNVVGCDLTGHAHNQRANTTEGSMYIHLTETTLVSQGRSITQQLQRLPGLGNAKFNAIICASGGFAGGNLESESYLEGAERMITSSIYPSLICGQLAKEFLLPGGLLVLPGAAAGFKASPGAIGYGASKAYVHHMVKSLSSKGSGMPEGSKIIGIAPITLDTEANRSAMPKEDFSSWTSLDELSSRLLEWAATPSSLQNASVYFIKTSGGVTQYIAKDVFS